MNKKLGRKMTRQEIVDAVTEPGTISKKKIKSVVMPPQTSTQANFEKIAKSLNIEPNSIKYQILKLFCEEKKATTVDTKVLIKRINNFNNEQLQILKIICSIKDFTDKIILQFVQLIKKFGTDRILTLYIFVELKGIEPGILNQFFITTLPQGEIKKIGKEAYLDELMEKTMSLDQVNVFYNICYKIKDITPETAIVLIPKIRQLKQQHSLVINTFFKEDVFFNDNPISDDNILSLINLWLSLPELTDKKRIEWLIKNLSKKSDKKKRDFQFLIQSFNKEIEKEEKGKSGGNIASSILGFFN